LRIIKGKEQAQKGGGSGKNKTETQKASNWKRCSSDKVESKRRGKRLEQGGNWEKKLKVRRQRGM